MYNVTGFETADIASTHDSATLSLKDTDITSVDLAANVRVFDVDGTLDTDGEDLSFTLNGVATAIATAGGTNTADEIGAELAAAINALSGFSAVAVNVDGTGDGVQVTSLTGEAIELSALTNTTDATDAVEYVEQDYKDVTVTNIGTQTLNIFSADAVTASLADASGSADSLSVNLATRAADDGFAKTVGDITANNIETINLDATGMDNGKATTVAAVKGNAMATLNITGDSDVTISSFATSAKLATIDAGTSTGDISLAAAPSAVDQTITTGGGNDTITMAALLTEADVIDAGGNNIPLNGQKLVLTQ